MRYLHLLLAMFVTSAAVAEASDDLQKRLNELGEIQGDDSIESWRELGEAAIALPAVPDSLVGKTASRIRPGSAGWSDAVAWVEANPEVQKAIKIGAEREFLGLPYGIDAVPESFANSGFSVALPDLETTISPTFHWLDHLKKLATWSKVEAWRRFDAGDSEGAIDLMVSDIGMLRKAADRGFLDEKQAAIALMLDAVVSLREMLYLNEDSLDAKRLRTLASTELSRIRVDRDRLLLPEHDRYVHQALLDTAFDHSTGRVDTEEFRRRFTRMEGEAAPLGQAGIDTRWRQLATWQASLEASREQLDNLYDDWWRRWRVRTGTDLAVMILAEPPYSERLNAVRYSGILSMLGDMDQLFNDRDRLVAELDATSIAAGLLSYKANRNTYPKFRRMAYGTDVPRHKDHDRFSVDRAPFIYFVPVEDWVINLGAGEVVVPAGTGILYSRGRDGFDNQAKRHAVDGYDGDLIIWPPPTAFDLRTDQTDG